MNAYRCLHHGPCSRFKVRASSIAHCCRNWSRGLRGRTVYSQAPKKNNQMTSSNVLAYSISGGPVAAAFLAQDLPFLEVCNVMPYRSAKSNGPRK
jgi:hypothetical protein